MPELPEVETTVSGINRKLKGLRIIDVWTDYGGAYHKGKNNVKDSSFFKKFRNAVVGKKIKGSSRIGKHVLVHLEEGANILIHMKMTGHLLYGIYEKIGKEWKPKGRDTPLHDPFNRFIHFVFSFSNGKHLALSDMRKFAKITFFHDKERGDVTDISAVGPDPMDKNFTFSLFNKRLRSKPLWKIKQVLMDQSVIAGIGNIYSDEILFEAEINPLEKVGNIPNNKIKSMFTATKKILKYSISLGGDSMSDYRNLDGLKGDFQNKHKAYHQTGKLCSKKNCPGKIVRLKIGGRSSHFCDVHQTLSQRKK